ncbi:MAG: putative RDD family membrane protein YckC [Saprospiraceae bacterium]|jgi:uncharacterized RDD family membrane protein YckC
MQIKESLTAQTEQHTVSLLRRLGAVFYDTILIASLIFIVAQWSLVITAEAKQHVLFQVAMLLNIFGVGFLYLSWFWVRGGQTVGMKAWKITLVSQQEFEAGQINPFIGWQQAFVRYCVSLVSWSVLGLGFIWILFNPRKRAWHDLASQSFLVKTIS